MRGRMHQNDYASLLQGKSMWRKVIKGKYDASPAHISTNDNKQKVVAPSKSSSSSNNDYRCSYCSRKFSCQQALAGHRNIHRCEWESLLDMQPEPDHGKVDQCCKLPIKTETSPVFNPTTALKRQMSRNTSPMQKVASSAIQKPLLCAAPQHPLSNAPLIRVANPKNTLTFTRVHHFPLVKPTNTPIGPSHRHPFVNSTNNHKDPSRRHSLASPTHTLKAPSRLYHLANSTNTLQGPLRWDTLPSPTNILKGPSPTCHLADPAKTFLGPLLNAPQRTFYGSVQTPHMASIRDPNHPVDYGAKPHGKLALRVKYESMIHKPCQCKRVGQSDMVLRTGSSLFGRKQMMGGNVRSFGKNNSHADLRSLLEDAGSSSNSRSEGGRGSKTHDLISSSFHPRGGKGIMADHDMFPFAPALERRHHTIAHSSQVQVPQPDHHREDLDLDLKL